MKKWYKICMIAVFTIILCTVVWIGTVQTRDNEGSVPVNAQEATYSGTEKPTPPATEPIESRFTAAQLEQLKTEIMCKLEENSFSGSVLIGAGDEILVDVAMGYSDIKDEVKNTTTTKYELGSVTKQFTAAAISKLAQEGKLFVDDTLDTYFKDFKDGKKVTIDNLLTMTSGIPDYLNDYIYMVETNERSQDSTFSKEEFMDWFNEKELQLDPGSNFHYSNTNYYLLGLIIEQVTGESYEDYMTKEILDPLFMYDSSMCMTDASARGYLTVDGEEGTLVDSSYFYSAGEMTSTTHDMFKWLNGFDNGRVVSGDFLTASVSNSKSGFNYGYGWFIDYQGDYYYHTGNTQVFYSVDLVSFEDDIKVIALSNINDVTVQQLGKDLFRITEKSLFPGKHDATEPATEGTTGEGSTENATKAG